MKLSRSNHFLAESVLEYSNLKDDKQTQDFSYTIH